VDIRDTTAELARGRITGNASFTWGFDNRLEGQLNFSTVDLQALLRSFTTSTQIGSGLLSGRLDFGGSNIQSVNDLTATLNATLRDAQALSYPVLEQLIPFIALGQGTGAIFNSGTVRGRLAGGIFRLEEASLQGNVVRLYIDGNITLEGGLNLDVTATTGQLSPNPLLLQRLGLGLPAAGPVPVSFLLEAGNLLSNSVIHLVVTGTVRSPTIRVQPLTTLAAGAVRFFLISAGVPIP
jgi:hypothetical protein